MLKHHDDLLFKLHGRKSTEGFELALSESNKPMTEDEFDEVWMDCQDEDYSLDYEKYRKVLLKKLNNPKRQ